MKTILKNISASSLSLMGFLFIILVSWFLINQSQNSSNENIHRWLQEQFQVVISDHIEKNYPQVQEIRFNKIYTKKTKNPLRIQIFFGYTLNIDDSSASGDVSLNGEAVLTQKENQENWLLSDFKVTNSFLEFSEPLYIKGSSDSLLK